MLIFNRCFSKYKVHHREKYVVKPIEGWGFSSDRRGILDQVYCCKHCFLFELIQSPTCLRKRFTSVFILWRLASASHSWWRLFTEILSIKKVQGGRQTDRQLAVDWSHVLSPPPPPQPLHLLSAVTVAPPPQVLRTAASGRQVTWHHQPMTWQVSLFHLYVSVFFHDSSFWFSIAFCTKRTVITSW